MSPYGLRLSANDSSAPDWPVATLTGTGTSTGTGGVLYSLAEPAETTPRKVVAPTSDRYTPRGQWYDRRAKERRRPQKSRV